MLAKGSLVGGTYVLGGPRSRHERSTVFFAEHGASGAAVSLEVFDLKTEGDTAIHQRFKARTHRKEVVEIEDGVPITDAGIDGKIGAPWVVTEAIAGESLAELAMRPDGEIRSEDAAIILRSVARCLAQAHGRGVAHGGLRPETVLLERPGKGGAAFRVRLLGFGVVEALNEIKAVDASTALPAAPAWMAPEQYELGTVSAQADIWALGLLAFWLFTGKMYWSSLYAENRSVNAMVRELQQSELDPATVRAVAMGRPGVLPAGFDDWFARCVVREPGKRFRDARELAWTLDRLLTPVVGKPASEPPGSPFRRASAEGEGERKEPPLVSKKLLVMVLSTVVVTLGASSIAIAIHDRSIEDERRQFGSQLARTRLFRWYFLGPVRRDGGVVDAGADAATDAGRFGDR